MSGFPPVVFDSHIGASSANVAAGVILRFSSVFWAAFVATRKHPASTLLALLNINVDPATDPTSTHEKFTAANYCSDLQQQRIPAVETQNMEFRQLGHSGLQVPALCFGTGTFGGGTEFFKAWGRNRRQRGAQAYRHLHGVRR
jgi:hypothetical protein